ncbi:MAG: hypothetical protein RIB98_08415 [Acidimicrobiales bacterium]
MSDIDVTAEGSSAHDRKRATVATSSLEGLVLEVPDAAFVAGVDVRTSAPERIPSPNEGSETVSGAVEIDADGQQPSVPLTVRVPVRSDWDRPEAIFMGRWDPASGVWVPVPTTFDDVGGELVAMLDHLSLFGLFRWIGDGVRWSAGQIKRLYDAALGLVDDSVAALMEGIDLLVTNVAGWLGVRGASPPDCGEGAAAAETYELVFSAEGDQPPLYGCLSVEDGSSILTVKIANNRPYGMVVDRHPSATLTLETWPGFEIDSGTGGLVAFYELLDSTLDLRQAYLPPGATVAYRIDASVLGAEVGNTLVIEATSTPAFTGVDLAVDLVKAIWLDSDDIDNTVDAINCLVSGGQSLVEVIDRFDSGSILSYLQEFEDCVRAALQIAVEPVFEVAKSILSTIPALISNLKDTGREFEVNNDLRIRVRPGGDIVERPRGPILSYGATFRSTSAIYEVTRENDWYLGAVEDGSAGVELTDVAVDDNGNLYGVGFSALYRLDSSGAATLVGSHDVGSTNALAFAPDGRLFSATTSGDLVLLDVATGTGAVVGEFGDGLTSSGDLIIRDGVLYGTVQGSGSGDALVEIDPASGRATVVVADLPPAVYGLFEDGEALLGITNRSDRCASGELIVIDLATSAWKFERCLAFAAGGASNGS